MFDEYNPYPKKRIAKPDVETRKERVETSETHLGHGYYAVQRSFITEYYLNGWPINTKTIRSLK